MIAPDTNNLADCLLKASNMPIRDLAQLVGVSRQSYHRWLKGRQITSQYQAIMKQLLQTYQQPEQTITVIYEVCSINFYCICGAHLTLSRRSKSLVTGIFCSQCRDHYWLNWQEGILRRDPSDEESQP